jgi:hypothetical protein
MCSFGMSGLKAVERYRGYPVPLYPFRRRRFKNMRETAPLSWERASTWSQMICGYAILSTSNSAAREEPVGEYCLERFRGRPWEPFSGTLLLQDARVSFVIPTSWPQGVPSPEYFPEPFWGVLSGGQSGLTISSGNRKIMINREASCLNTL